MSWISRSRPGSPNLARFRRKRNEENRLLWFQLTCVLRYPEPYYADELIEAVLTSKTAPTDGDGVAKWKAAADGVEVTFESAEAVNKAMKTVWKSRAATAESDYVQPSGDIIAVVSRAKAIETAEGGMLASTSVDATQPITLSMRPAKKRALLIELHDTLAVHQCPHQVDNWHFTREPHDAIETGVAIQ